MMLISSYMLFFKGSITYSFGSKKVVIEGPKSLPGVIAAIGSTHEVFNYQSDVNQADAVVRGQVTL